MNKKTKIVGCLTAYLFAETVVLAYRNVKLIQKYNNLAGEYNHLLEGAQYFQNVALAAMRRLPVSSIEDMKIDVDFLHIAAKEKF